MLAELRREVQRELAAARATRADRGAVEAIAERAAELAPIAAPESRQWSRARPAPPPPPTVAVGARVGVPRLNARGVVRSLSGDGREAEVEMGGLRVRVKTAELTPPEAVDAGFEGAAPVTYVPAAPPLPLPSRPVPLQLDLRGQRAAEATEAVEQYLDDAVLAGLPSVRIIHGHGTGAVRKAVRELLSRHSLVRSWAPADRREGGDGATEVQLAG